MSISQHISYKENVYSRAATRLGIDKEPNDKQMTNIRTIAEEEYKPVQI